MPFKSFTTKTFVPKHVDSTGVQQLSQKDLARQALNELCMMISCAYQAHSDDFVAIKKYFLRNYFVRLTPHPSDGYLIKVK